jgi:hypothetical protein
VGSVGASALAALTLIAGVRQMAAARAAAEEESRSHRACRYVAEPPADDPADEFFSPSRVDYGSLSFALIMDLSPVWAACRAPNLMIVARWDSMTA